MRGRMRRSNTLDRIFQIKKNFPDDDIQWWTKADSHHPFSDIKLPTFFYVCIVSRSFYSRSFMTYQHQNFKNTYTSCKVKTIVILMRKVHSHSFFSHQWNESKFRKSSLGATISVLHIIILHLSIYILYMIKKKIHSHC